MSNADIKTDLDQSGMSIEEFLWCIVRYWRDHPELHVSGIPESPERQHARLLGLWQTFQDLPDVYHGISHVVLASIRNEKTAENAKLRTAA